MSGKIFRVSESWDIAEDLLDEALAAIPGSPEAARAVEQYETASRFVNWPHEIPPPKPNDRSTKEGP